MSDVAIQVENLGKEYRLGIINHGTLRQDLQSWWARMRGKEDPNTKVDVSATLSAERFWALRNVSFTVRRGEIVGIIGRNGAGKSTLLKILSQVTAPTAGRVCLNGRVASLLEVGTGFHPELTGRENVYLNGAILGMSKVEVARKFDEIVDFSGIERFIDTPVKRYSSGMYVRLAFAVAAHLEPEILIVDEVLAVGDAQFQKKCLGKMEESGREGRTILFVSHNMGAVSSLTSRAVLLQSGSVVIDDSTPEVIEKYLSTFYANQGHWYAPEENVNPVQILSVCAMGVDGSATGQYDVMKSLDIRLEYVVREKTAGAVVAVNVHGFDGAHILSVEDSDTNKDLLLGRECGRFEATVRLPGAWLNSGIYYLRVGCGIPGVRSFENIEAFRFELVETGDIAMRGHRSGYLLPVLEWRTSKLMI